jgi:hypothetical protein
MKSLLAPERSAKSAAMLKWTGDDVAGWMSQPIGLYRYTVHAEGAGRFVPGTVTAAYVAEHPPKIDQPARAKHARRFPR